MMSYPDACPVCQPGIPDVALPLGDAKEVSGGTLADYECASCGTAWSTWFDRHGWPIDRSIAPVTAEQAQEHRAVLERAMRRRAA